MMHIWILLLTFGLVKNHIIRKEGNVYTNEIQISQEDDENIDVNLRKIQKIQLEDSSGHKASEHSAMEAEYTLKEDLLYITYQQSAWQQLVAQVDQWELTGTLSYKLRSLNPAHVKDEDASMLLDNALSAVKPFLNNSVEIADVGTALNLHKCIVNGVTEGLQRFGPAKLSVNDDLTTLSFTLTSDTLSMSCAWYQWILLKYSGIVSATLSSITVEIVVDLKLQPDQHPVVRRTEVKELGEIKSEITGIGPLGLLVRTIINKIIQQYRVLIIQGLEHKAPMVMQASFDNVKLPNTENITKKNKNDRESIEDTNEEIESSIILENQKVDHKYNRTARR